MKGCFVCPSTIRSSCLLFAQLIILNRPSSLTSLPSFPRITPAILARFGATTTRRANGSDSMPKRYALSRAAQKLFSTSIRRLSSSTPRELPHRIRCPSALQGPFSAPVHSPRQFLSSITTITPFSRTVYGQASMDYPELYNLSPTIP